MGWPAAIAVIGSSALSAGASMANTGAMNKRAERVANKTNAQNYKMFQEQQEYNWDMWNATNRYNTPANQRKLLEEAGYNPAVLSETPSVGASNQGSSVSPNSAVTPQVFNADLSALNGLAQSYQAIQQGELLKTQKEGQQVDNMYKGLTHARDLELSGLDAEAKKIQNRVAASTEQQKIDQETGIAALYANQANVQAEFVEQEQIKTELAKMYGPVKGYYEYKKIEAEYENLKKDLDVKDAQKVMYDRTGLAAFKQAEYSGELVESTKDLNKAQSREFNARAYGQELDNLSEQEFKELGQKTGIGKNAWKVIIELIKALR